MNRVLVVDDEPQIRRALRTSLEAHGYEVQTVGTGEEAVIGAAEIAPELMLLDLGLPDLDGTEVIRRVRGFTEMPIIVLSVRDRQEDKIGDSEDWQFFHTQENKSGEQSSDHGTINYQSTFCETDKRYESFLDAGFFELFPVLHDVEHPGTSDTE